MQHLRVIAPPDLSDHALRSLAGREGVAHLVVHRGAALAPQGDVFEADVTREALDALLSDLADAGLRERGAITIENLDTALSTAVTKAEEEAPGDGADALVWDELVARTEEESTASFAFLALMCLACLIAAVGVVTDSPVTLVGAMVVGPEFGPLAALAVALIGRRGDLARKAALALGIGYPLGMAVTALATLAFEAAGWVTLESFAHLRQVDFVYQVGPFSFVVALLAGAAGMLSITSSKSAALVGVFISVTTIPAAGFAVVAATVQEWRLAAESIVQLAVNLVGVVIACAGTLWVMRRLNGNSAPGA